MNPNYLVVAGQIIDLCGALTMAWGAFVTKDEAIAIGLPRWVGQTQEEHLNNPTVRSLISNGRYARAGVWMLAVGFLLQIIGTLAK